MTNDDAKLPLSQSRRPSPRGGREPLPIEVPSRLSERYWGTATKYQFWYSVLGLVLGLICVLAGLTLVLHGIGGSTSWTADILGAKSELSDATPGVVFSVLGLFIIWTTRYRVRGRSK